MCSLRNGGLVVWGVHGVRFVGVGFWGFGDVSRGLWGVELLQGGAVEGSEKFQHNISSIVPGAHHRSLPQELC